MLAMAANISAQKLSAYLYQGQYWDYVSVAAGTAIGLIAKYEMDKRAIFGFKPHSHAHNAQRFLLYSCFGVGTTAVFWLTEFSFQYLFSNQNARYVGAVIGLTLGYIVKYQIDRRITFAK
jgi:putative flippase GtrA